MSRELVTLCSSCIEYAGAVVEVVMSSRQG